MKYFVVIKGALVVSWRNPAKSQEFSDEQAAMVSAQLLRTHPLRTHPTPITSRLLRLKFNCQLSQLFRLTLISKRGEEQNFLERFRCPKTRLTLGDRAFQSVEPSLWNALPEPIGNIMSFNAFKLLLKLIFLV